MFSLTTRSAPRSKDRGLRKSFRSQRSATGWNGWHRLKSMALRVCLDDGFPSCFGQGAVWRSSSRTRSGLAILRGCLVRREGRGREFRTAPARRREGGRQAESGERRPQPGGYVRGPAVAAARGPARSKARGEVNSPRQRRGERPQGCEDSALRYRVAWRGRGRHRLKACATGDQQARALARVAADW
jgi:hypothetical protein